MKERVDLSSIVLALQQTLRVARDLLEDLCFTRHTNRLAVMGTLFPYPRDVAQAGLTTKMLLVAARKACMEGQHYIIRAPKIAA
jgi:hypothetical protein